MMEEQWCKCRIVEPMIMQKGDTLICLNCHSTKELPPRIDLEWEKQKRDILKGGKIYYGTFAKEVLVEMLVNRDAEILDTWKAWTKHREPYRNAYEYRVKVAEKIEYLTFEEV